MPNGNSHSAFVICSVKLYEGKGVACLDARGKPLEYIPIADIEKSHRVRDMLNGALNGERRYRSLDWSFLDEPSSENLPQAPLAPESTPPRNPGGAADPKSKSGK